MTFLKVFEMKLYVGRQENIPERLRYQKSIFEHEHPSNFLSIIQKLRQKELTIEFWTNNNDIVNLCYVEEVVVCDSFRRKKRFSSHPDFKTWKETLSPGEMWTLFGEEWEPSNLTPARSLNSQ